MGTVSERLGLQRINSSVKELGYRYHQIYKKQKDECIANNDAEGEDTYDKSEKKAYKIYDDLKNVFREYNESL